MTRVRCDVSEHLPDGSIDVEVDPPCPCSLLTRHAVEEGAVEFIVEVVPSEARLRMPGVGALDVSIEQGQEGGAVCSRPLWAWLESGLYVRPIKREDMEDVIHVILGSCIDGSPSRLGDEHFYSARVGLCSLRLAVPSSCGPIHGPAVEIEVGEGADTTVELLGPTLEQALACTDGPLRTHAWSDELRAQRDGLRRGGEE